MYSIKEFLIPAGDKNRPGTRLHPEGLIIHSTAMDDVPDENIAKYFAFNKTAKTTNIASAHYAVDWDSITEMIPENEVAYHAGPNANYKYLSIEMCETNDPARFMEIWKRSVWLAVEICKRYSWNPDETIRSHNWVSRTLGGTDHTDPYAFFEQFGKTMDDFIADVKEVMKGGVNVDKPDLKINAIQDIMNLNSKLWFVADEDHKKVLEYINEHFRKNFEGVK